MKVVFDTRPGFYKNGKTTGYVFDRLEEKYGLVEYFMKHKKEMVAIAVTQKILSSKTFRGEYVLQTVESAYRDAISRRWFDNKIDGVPTAASNKRKMERLKAGMGGRARPSFVDTGLYRKSIRVRMIR